jgi:cytoskeletal protein CcmA (bactofilin family)
MNMAFASKPSTEVKTASVLAHDLVIRGDVENHGDLRVEGHLEGNVTGNGSVTVAEQGSVVGNVEGRQVVVMGRVEGNVVGHEKVEVLEKATVRGDMKSARISVEEGAAVAGKFETSVPSVAAVESKSGA